MKEWKTVEEKARLIGTDEIEISDRVKLVKMVSGNFRPEIAGNQTQPELLTAADQNAIRHEFGIPEIEDFDSNILIPGNLPEEKKEEKSENEFDQNELIPD